jgi:hypothetical protein
VDVDRIDDPNSQQLRTVKLLALSDIRIAQVVLADMGIVKFLDKKYKQCPTCESTVLRDWGDSDSLPRCHICQYDFTVTQDTWEEWRRREIATQARKRQRREAVELSQISFEEYLQQSEDEIT